MEFVLTHASVLKQKCGLAKAELCDPLDKWKYEKSIIRHGRPYVSGIFEKDPSEMTPLSRSQSPGPPPCGE
jgi:hypothetical protein